MRIYLFLNMMNQTTEEIKTYAHSNTDHKRDKTELVTIN